MNLSTCRVRAAVLTFATLFGGGALAQQQAPQSLPGGLERVQGSKVALAYVRPGTVWTKYRTILLRTLAVPASARNTAPPGTFAPFGESYMLSDSDVATLQSDFAKSMHDTLGNAGYTFVTTAQADTLIVAPVVTKILLNAPTYSSRELSSGMGQTFTAGAGSITIAAVMADGASKTVIAEVKDRNYGSNIWNMNNSVTNLEQAKQAFDQWANDLKDKLQST
jgi:hypothetical protein